MVGVSGVVVGFLGAAGGASAVAVALSGWGVWGGFDRLDGRRLGALCRWLWCF